MVFVKYHKHKILKNLVIIKYHEHKGLRFADFSETPSGGPMLYFFHNFNILIYNIKKYQVRTRLANISTFPFGYFKQITFR